MLKLKKGYSIHVNFVFKCTKYIREIIFSRTSKERLSSFTLQEIVRFVIV